MNLSFIVQGPVYIDKFENRTQALINSIKTYFPNSEIILSTWQNSIIEGIKCNRIILNDDPGAIFSDSHEKWFDNINRQIISTKNGILVSNNDIVIKIRSDLEFVNNNLLKIISKNINHINDGMLICWGKAIPFLYPFYLPDFIHIGNKNTLLKIWNIDLATSDDSNYFKEKFNHFKIYRLNPFYFNINKSFSRLHPEQYIYLKGYGKIYNYQHHLEKITLKKRVEYLKLMYSTITYYGSFELGVYSHKHRIRKLNDRFVNFYSNFYKYSFSKKKLAYLVIFIIFIINFIRQVKGEIKSFSL